jgi:hypothetical protein
MNVKNKNISFQRDDRLTSNARRLLLNLRRKNLRLERFSSSVTGTQKVCINSSIGRKAIFATQFWIGVIGCIDILE